MCRILAAYGISLFDWLIGKKSELKFIDVETFFRLLLSRPMPAGFFAGVFD